MQYQIKRMRSPNPDGSDRSEPFGSFEAATPEAALVLAQIEWIRQHDRRVECQLLVAD